jgi:hypothetical protein
MEKHLHITAIHQWHTLPRYSVVLLRFSEMKTDRGSVYKDLLIASGGHRTQATAAAKAAKAKGTACVPPIAASSHSHVVTAHELYSGKHNAASDSLQKV